MFNKKTELECVFAAIHYINSRPAVQAWMAFCCKFPAYLLPMAQKQSSGFEFGLAPPFWGLLFDTSTLAPRRAKAKDLLYAKLNLQLKIS